MRMVTDCEGGAKGNILNSWLMMDDDNDEDVCDQSLSLSTLTCVFFVQLCFYL